MADRTQDMIVTDLSQINVGDVVQVSVQLRDRQTGNDFWWKRFACVLTVGKPWRQEFTALTLKMQIDPDKDVRIISLDDEKQVVELLPEDKWPQGVIAMRMKWITKGVIKLDH